MPCQYCNGSHSAFDPCLESIAALGSPNAREENVIARTTFKSALAVACPLCNAHPGFGCIVTKGYRTGLLASTLHNERLRAVGDENAEAMRAKCIEIVAMHGGSVEIEAAIRNIKL